MRTALVRSGGVSPQRRLEEAIIAFEKDLSSEQRQLLRAGRSTVPHVDDVMVLTAEIDSSLAAQGYRIPYGPRMTTFLSSLQQFAALGDILVGGSQGLVARGSWSVIRVFLLVSCGRFNIIIANLQAISKYSPYIDKLSKLFMKLGQTLPQNEDLAKLFPRSQALQNRLLEYYIPVIDLCREVLRLSNQNRVAQIFTNIMDTLDSFQDRLEEKSNALRRQVQLETIKTIQAVARRNDHSWSLADQFLSRHKIEQQQRYKDQVLRVCSTFNYQIYWKQIKKAGITSLLGEAPNYQSWKKSKRASTLLYSGPLGFGKSVLLANMVDDLFLQKESIIAYFFCKFDVDESLWCRTILGCLARQLVEHVSDIDRLKTILGDSPSQLDTDQLTSVIEKCVLRPIHFVLDGLDECTQTERTEIVRILRDLQGKIPLSVCIATRSNEKDTALVGDEHNTVMYREKMPENNPDIEAYIEFQISALIAAEELVIDGDDLVKEIKQKLLQGSEGMFLWVYLQIVSLCSMESNHDLREALQNLPKDLPETFARLLVNSTPSRYRKRLIELVMVALRPLHAEELREALSVEPGNTVYNPEQRINRIDLVLRSCGGLIVVDEEEETIRFVHSSVSHFLISQAQDIIEVQMANSNVSRTILTYLNYSVFDTMVARRTTTTLPLEAIPGAILRGKAPVLAKLAGSSQKTPLDRQLIYAESSHSEKQHRFLIYAKAYGLRHLADFKCDPDMAKLFRSAVAKDRLSASFDNPDHHPLVRAVETDNAQFISLFMELLKSYMDRSLAKRIIRLASVLGKTACLNILVLNYDTPGDLWELAILEDQPNLVAAMLCQDHINPNLPMASKYDVDHVNDNLAFQWRMESWAEANFEKTLLQDTPLLKAIRVHSVTTVEMLLANLRVDPQGGHVVPIRLAAEFGSLDILKLLLAKGHPPVHSPDSWCMWEAVWESHALLAIEMTDALVGAGVLLINEKYWRDQPLLIATMRHANPAAIDGILQILLKQPDCKVNEIYEEKKLGAVWKRATALDIAHELSQSQRVTDKTITILRTSGALKAQDLSRTEVKQ